MKELFSKMEVSQNQENESSNKIETSIPIEQSLRHPLEHRWTFWFYENAKGRDWLQNLHQVYIFDTVEDFWCLFNHIQSASDLMHGSDYYIFREGIKPMWEDDKNKRGGKWLVNVDRGSSLNDLWLNLLLFIIGESFDEYGEEVHGAVVNRRKLDKISVWISDSENREIIMGIGNKIKHECLNLQSDSKILFEKHSDSQIKQGSRVKYLYTI